MINIGKKTPNICLPSTLGHDVCLHDYKGQYVVLFFYPKDNTPGCTKEALEFNAYKDTFAQHNAQIFGVSKDSLKSHEKFIQKQGLTIPLLSDEDAQLLQAFDVWKEKSMYGRTYMGIERSTFLINEHSEICEIWRKVKVTGHVKAVLERLKELQT